MAAQLIDGNTIAQTIRTELSAEITRLKEQFQTTPGLAVILVGENPASQSYVRGKNKACRDMGMYSEQHTLPTATTEREVLQLIDQLNHASNIHGILVQSPLPEHLNEETITRAILPTKDVDGLHPMNMGQLLIGEPGFKPCTPYGIQKMLVYSGILIEGRHVVVVGRSNLVGKPIAAILMQKQPNANATVTLCHSRTKNLAEFTRQADILIAAIGQPEMITADMVSPHAVVIDVGINRVEDPSKPKGYKLVGDVKFDDVSQKCQAITPVPGGVGPMTVTMLLYNTVQAAKIAAGAGA